MLAARKRLKFCQTCDDEEKRVFRREVLERSRCARALTSHGLASRLTGLGSSMSESILCTAEVPAFDPATGQVAIYCHHLVSAPTSIAAAYSGPGTLLFDEPPSRAFGSSSATDQEAADGGEGRQRKRRRLRQTPDESSTPADWIRHRERQAARQVTSTDRETEAHHAQIAPRLQSAIDAVRAEWMNSTGRSGWTGLESSAWEWKGHDDETAKKEVELAALAGAAAHTDHNLGPLLLPDDSTCELPASACAGRLVVSDDSVGTKRLALQSDEGNRLATVLLPPSSGFLLSDMMTWSDQRSGIAHIGREKGGWDLLLIESVPLLPRGALPPHLAQTVDVAPPVAVPSPPWPNASATRSASYETFDPYDLWKLDVPALLGDRPSIVAVWLTNRVKVRDNEQKASSSLPLIPPSCSQRSSAGSSRRSSSRCGRSANPWNGTGSRSLRKRANQFGRSMRSIAVATKASRHRCNLRPGVVLTHRFPKGLLIGRYTPDGAGAQVPSVPAIPDGKVFLSTPIGHSRKPYLLGALLQTPARTLIRVTDPHSLPQIFSVPTCTDTTARPTSSSSLRG